MSGLRRVRGLFIATLAVVILLVHAGSARAQSQVRVNDDQTTIWRPGFSTVAEIVSAGTVLDVVGKNGNWYEVIVPNRTNRNATGFVAISRVTALDQKPLPAPARRNPSTAGGVAPAARSKTPRARVRLFAQGGYGRFTAEETFDAVLGSAGGGWFGGGIQVRMPSGLFVEAAVDRFQKTGTRVFVFNGEVFDLGVEDKVRIVPVTGSVGYRFATRARYVPYVSAGVGGVFFRETSPGASEEENADERFGFYQAIAGLEIPASRSAAVAFEAQYSTTRQALKAGTALIFDERDLGGVQFRIKVLFGR